MTRRGAATLNAGVRRARTILGVDGVRRQLVNTCCADCAACQVCQPSAVEVLLEDFVDVSCCFIGAGHSYLPVGLAARINSLGWLLVPNVLSGGSMTCVYQWDEEFAATKPYHNEYYNTGYCADCNNGVMICKAPYWGIRVRATLQIRTAFIEVYAWVYNPESICHESDCATIGFYGDYWEYVFWGTTTPYGSDYWCVKTEETAQTDFVAPTFACINAGPIYHPCFDSGQVTVRKA